MSLQFRLRWGCWLRRGDALRHPQVLRRCGRRSVAISTGATATWRTLSSGSRDSLRLRRHGGVCVVVPVGPSLAQGRACFSTVQEEDPENCETIKEKPRVSEKDSIIRDIMLATHQTIDEMLLYHPELETRFTYSLARTDLCTKPTAPSSDLSAQTGLPSLPNLRLESKRSNELSDKGTTNVAVRSDEWLSNVQSNQLNKRESASNESVPSESNSSRPAQNDTLWVFDKARLAWTKIASTVVSDEMKSDDASVHESTMPRQMAVGINKQSQPLVMTLLNTEHNDDAWVSMFDDEFEDHPLEAKREDSVFFLQSVPMEQLLEASDEDKHNFDEEFPSYSRLISRAIAFLDVMTIREWRVWDSDAEDETDDGLDDGDRVDEGIEEFGEGIEINLDDAMDVEDSYAMGTTKVDSESKLLMKMEPLLLDVLSGNQSLTTEDYNVILLLMACTSAYQNHDIMTTLMRIFEHMKSDVTQASPDGFTYAILILALSRRGRAQFVACQLIYEMMDQLNLFHNGEAFIQAMRCLELCKRIEHAEELLHLVKSNTEDFIKIPAEAVDCMLRLYQREQKTAEAMKLLDEHIDYMGPGPYITTLYFTTSDWPNFGGTNENLRTLYQYLIQKFKIYESILNADPRAGRKLWRNLIISIARMSPKRETQATVYPEMIRECVWALLRNMWYRPDADVLRIGLEAAGRLEDAKLAALLATRLLATRPFANETWSEEVRHYKATQSLVLPSTFKAVMKICVEAKCASSISEVLQMLDHPDVIISRTFKSQFMNQAVVGFIRTSELMKAKATLEEIAAQGLEVSDDNYALLIQNLALNNHASDALELVREIEGGKFGDVKLGPSYHIAKIISLLQMKKWQGVIDAHREMKETGLLSNAITTHGVVLASMRLGDSNNVVEVLEEAIESEIPLNMGCFEQALKCLVPDLVDEDARISTIRLKLRERVDKAPKSTLAQQYLNLSKSLRIAQVEEERRASNNLSNVDLKKRRTQAWMTAHKCLLELHHSLA